MRHKRYETTRQDTGGSLSFSGRLDAVKISRVHNRVLTDSVEVSDSMVATSSTAGETVSIRVADSAAHSISADLKPPTDTVLTVVGPPSEGEAHISVSRLLVERLRREGGNWGEPQDTSRLGARQEQGIDFLVPGKDGASDLHIQVIRANTSQNLWRSISLTGRVNGRWDLEETAQALKDAIQKKALRMSLRDRQGITLVLDATLVANHALYSAVQTFRKKHMRWTRELGFSSVWCVGPVADLVWRLDSTRDTLGPSDP